ncbi:MAG TPA: hypothetical protein VNN18_11915 [Candidatus Xenobia bacterium]|nr:hypothetical protein [Candidatus Xenobia bacterium]
MRGASFALSLALALLLLFPAVPETARPQNTYGGLDWTPNGKAIVYSALAGGRMRLLAIPRSGGAPVQLAQEPATLLDPQVSPDGRWIACTRTIQSKTIWKMQLQGKD